MSVCTDAAARAQNFLALDAIQNLRGKLVTPVHPLSGNSRAIAWSFRFSYSRALHRIEVKNFAVDKDNSVHRLGGAEP
jgi:hypothetical protein